MVRNWFQKSSARYNDFVKALLANDLEYMNLYMNKMTEAVFSTFDTGRHPSADRAGAVLPWVCVGPDRGCRAELQDHIQSGKRIREI